MPDPVDVTVAVTVGPVFTFNNVAIANQAPTTSDPGDQVELPPRRQQEKAPVFQMQPDSRILQRVRGARPDRAAETQDVARNVDDVDRLQVSRFRERFGGDAHAVASPGETSPALE